MNKLQISLATLAAVGTLSLSTIAPASADSAASTRNIILGAAAIAGIAIEANVAQKNARANSVSGYLSDGSTVYGDGHVVDPNGNSYYPGNDGESISCDDGSCYLTSTSDVNVGWNPNPNQNWNVNQTYNVAQNRNWNANQNRPNVNRDQYRNANQNQANANRDQNMNVNRNQPNARQDASRNGQIVSKNVQRDQNGHDAPSHDDRSKR